MPGPPAAATATPTALRLRRQRPYRRRHALALVGVERVSRWASLSTSSVARRTPPIVGMGASIVRPGRSAYAIHPSVSGRSPVLDDRLTISSMRGVERRAIRRPRYPSASVDNTGCGTGCAVAGVADHLVRRSPPTTRSPSAISTGRDQRKTPNCIWGPRVSSCPRRRVASPRDVPTSSGPELTSACRTASRRGSWTTPWR